MSKPKTSSRIFGLDFLRALAILFVVLGHGALLLPESFKSLHRWIVFDGVSIFFVLSGYLIGGILIRNLEQGPVNTKGLLHFWIRRWFRTLPNYFLILGLLIGLHLYFYPEVHLGEFKSYFFFVQNFWSPHPPYFPEAWSLSIEEWFYLISPLLMVLFIRLFKLAPKKAVLVVAGIILLGSTLYRYQLFLSLEEISRLEWASFFRKQVLSRLDSLMYGILAAAWHYYGTDSWRAYKKLSLGFGIMFFALSKLFYQFDLIPIDSLFHAVFSFSLTALATSLLLPYLSQWNTARGTGARLITWISLISYSLYLINLSLVQGFIIQRIDWAFIEGDALRIGLQYAVFWSLSLFGAHLIYRYYEIPMTKLRDHPKIKGRFNGSPKE